MRSYLITFNEYRSSLLGCKPPKSPDQYLVYFKMQLYENRPQQIPYAPKEIMDTDCITPTKVATKLQVQSIDSPIPHCLMPPRGSFVRSHDMTFVYSCQQFAGDVLQVLRAALHCLRRLQFKKATVDQQIQSAKIIGVFFFFCSLGIDLSSKMTERTYFIFRKARRRKLTSTRNIYCTQNCGCKLKRELFSGPSANKGNTEERTRVAFSSVSRSKCCTSKEEHCGNYIPRCGLLSIGRKAPWPF